VYTTVYLALHDVSLLVFDLVDQGTHTMSYSDAELVAVLESSSRIGFPADARWCTVSGMSAETERA
jgi:hypothetical protein